MKRKIAGLAILCSTMTSLVSAQGINFNHGKLDLDANYCYNTQDEAGYMKYSQQLVERYLWNNDFEISNVLGSIRWIKAPAHLELMKKWGERALALKDNSLSNATLAMAYSALKDKANALKYIDAAMASSERDKDGYINNIAGLKKQMMDSCRGRF